MTPKLSDTGIKAPLADTIAIMAQHVDVVHFGDTDHKTLEAIKIVANPAMLAKLASAGITEIMLEVYATKQYAVNEYKNKAMSRPDFASLTKGAWNENTGEYTADLVDNGVDFGMEIHFVDPRADRETPNNAEEYEQEHLETVVNDQDLAKNIDTALAGKKGLLIYGNDHGAYDINTDLNAALQSSYAEIEVWESRKKFEELYIFDAELERDFFPKIAAIKKEPPELVYFLDEGKVYMTDDTPEAMKQDILAKFGNAVTPPVIPANHPHPAPSTP